MTTAEQITVKNARFNDAMSRETCCYSCDVYFDGAHLAHVRNTGGGGADFWDHVTGSDPRKRSDVAHALATETGLLEPDMLILSMACGMTAAQAMTEIREIVG